MHTCSLLLTCPTDRIPIFTSYPPLGNRGHLCCSLLPVPRGRRSQAAHRTHDTTVGESPLLLELNYLTLWDRHEDGDTASDKEARHQTMTV